MLHFYMMSFFTNYLVILVINEIETLVNEEKHPGNYVIDFDASNLSSGVYFYKLQAGNPSSGSEQGFVEIKKMILLK